MISLKSMALTCYQIKRRVLSSHRLSSSYHRVMSLTWADNFLFILWFIGQFRDLDQIYDESIFSLIGESIISIIVECDLPTYKAWQFCFVDVIPWFVRHGGLFHSENSFRGIQVLLNEKRNLKLPWPWGISQTPCSLDNLTWMIVTSFLHRDVFHFTLTTRGKGTCLCEDREWQTTELCDYQSQFEELLMVLIRNTTKHVISCSGSVWNGQRCNRWIVPPDLLSGKRLWITMDDSLTQDHIRPRTTIEKVSESVYPAIELESIVLLLFYYHVQFKKCINCIFRF
ncbi:unnamed protein product [Eruca vesicaria subsp. sativa]|uniref:Maturase K n=1 Tax=Eruca vesicaria subsp. sativa TaxID=29727 RepID=A0ABC8J7V6_ERUVS|nr:unnamed protein product [Eruca vesicaria subsp. sativa]